MSHRVNPISFQIVRFFKCSRLRFRTSLSNVASTSALSWVMLSLIWLVVEPRSFIHYYRFLQTLLFLGVFLYHHLPSRDILNGVDHLIIAHAPPHRPCSFFSFLEIQCGSHSFSNVLRPRKRCQFLLPAPGNSAVPVCALISRIHGRNTSRASCLPLLCSSAQRMHKDATRKLHVFHPLFIASHIETLLAYRSQPP